MGEVFLQFPERMSQNSYDEFKAFLRLVLRRAKRSVIETPPPLPHNKEPE